MTRLFKKYQNFLLSKIGKTKVFLREALTQNVTLKLISVMMTLTLFILIAGESVQVSKTVKIEYVTAENMVIVNEVPFEFEIVLSGPKSAIGMIRSQKFLYKVNLRDAAPGMSRVKINPRLLGLDRRIIISSMNPSVLYPRLEHAAAKKTPIH